MLSDTMLCAAPTLWYSEKLRSPDPAPQISYLFRLLRSSMFPRIEQKQGSWVKKADTGNIREVWNPDQGKKKERER
jgi:hypothetical protein